LTLAIEIFSRVELKYLLSTEDVDALMPLLAENMDCDPYNFGGKTYQISNIYFDTAQNELIIKSLEKPVYKEKLRLRSYGRVENPEQTVFLEIKKKFDGVVYKRRTPFTYNNAISFLEEQKLPENEKTNWQVLREIMDLQKRYVLLPRVFISYERLAFFGNNNSDFRITLDRNIITRREDLKLDSEIYGTPLLQEGMWLMEAKAFKSFPLWFAKFLSNRKIYSRSFSKYGSEYRVYRSKEYEF
jgi:hypothetical protein